MEIHRVDFHHISNRFFEIGGPKWTRFPAGKPRRLEQSTGLFLRAGFRVLEVLSSSNPFGVSILVCEIGGPKWTRTTDLTIISRVL